MIRGDSPAALWQSRTMVQRVHILVDADARWYPDTPASRRLLHVAATRAIHQLWVACAATPSPVLREALAGEAAALGA